MNRGLLRHTIRIFVFMLALGTVLYIGQTSDPIQTGTVTLPDKSVIQVDAARTFKEHEQGLSDRKELDHDQGMLFIYGRYAEPHFWMKDMLFPLDIIWINDGQITGFDENLQPEFPPKTLYSPEFPINSVLEVNAGFVEKNGLKVGDKLDIELLN